MRKRKLGESNDMEQTLTEIELAWLAGIVDGEGCLFFAVRKDYPTHRAIRCDIRVCMAHHDTINRVADMFTTILGSDDSVGLYTETREVARERPLRDCTVHGRRSVLRVLQVMLPYLYTKRLEAELAISYLLKSAQHTRYRTTELDRAMAEAATELRHGRGEARAQELLCQVIPSQAASGQSSTGDAEGVETRGLSPDNKDPHECPAPERQLKLVEGEEIVRTSGQNRSAV